MINKIIFGFLIAILVLGISSNAVNAQQIITPTQPKNLAVVTGEGGPLLPQQTQQQQAAIDLNNFADLSTETKQKISTFFDQCPAGIILYKYLGEMYVYCLTTPFSGILHGPSGQQINVDIDVDHSSSDDDDDDTGPDKDCLYNASLPKCKPIDGECPDGFNMNEDGNCFPDHSDGGCPEGTHGVDDDETGQCYKDDEVDCPDGMEQVGNNCTYVETDDSLPTPEEEEQAQEEQTEEEDNNIIEEPTTTTTDDSSSTDEPEQQSEENSEEDNSSDEGGEENNN